jgi:hypothetical protein
MKTRERDNQPPPELQFELKYCERCGGLWLRPMGGGQLYCVGCWLEMKKLPKASRREKRPGRSQRSGSNGAEGEVKTYGDGDGLYLDAKWGAA